jgi:hypothetical protein
MAKYLEEGGYEVTLGPSLRMADIGHETWTFWVMATGLGSRKNPSVGARVEFDPVTCDFNVIPASQAKFHGPSPADKELASAVRRMLDDVRPRLGRGAA